MKWSERPLLIVVKGDDAITDKQLLDWLVDKIAKWCIPDEVVFVDELPMTATGKISKKDLRLQFKDHKLAGS